MEFILISIAIGLWATHITRRCLRWIEIDQSSQHWKTIGLWLLALATPVLAVATRFSVFDYAALLHHLPRSGFLQIAIISQAIILLGCWISLELNINRIENKHRNYEQVN